MQKSIIKLGINLKAFKKSKQIYKYYEESQLIAFKTVLTWESWPLKKRTWQKLI
jgi:hypothetical protein